MNISKQLTAITNLIKVLEKSETPDIELLRELHQAAQSLVNINTHPGHSPLTCPCVK